MVLGAREIMGLLAFLACYLFFNAFKRLDALEMKANAQDKASGQQVVHVENIRDDVRLLDAKFEAFTQKMTDKLDRVISNQKV